jgi:hypothetical protein
MNQTDNTANSAQEKPREYVYYDGELFGVRLTDEEWERLTEADLRQAILAYGGREVNACRMEPITCLIPNVANTISEVLRRDPIPRNYNRFLPRTPIYETQKC